MNFSMFMPVDIRSGKDCVKENAACFALGKHALLVTSRHAAVASGAQGDVIAVLDSLGIGHTVFNQIGENPLLSVCYEGGKSAQEAGADFVIGIGGGSAMDAAKAVAAFAANPGIAPMEIYTAERKPSLPIILIPTTSGTGSEVNPYAVMTLDEKGVKKTFTDKKQSYAKYAFLDAAYTMSLSETYTLSCALDAFAHCCESYLSPKADALSRIFAGWGANQLYRYIKNFEAGRELTFAERETLLYASCAGGIAINKTGTGFPHPLGYNITLSYGVPHGSACAVFYRQYLTLNEKAAPDLCEALYEAIGASGEEIKDVIPARSMVNLALDEDIIRAFVDKVKGAGNYKNSPYVISEDEMLAIYRELFVK
ncbi:MAG: iron-containing alcohol dehydrogenase [Clostridia bacterium]|nr:iron-containing alcohol dehydrogenase [Clostridia bacterium]